MERKLILIAVIALIALLMAPVQAQNISFSNLGGSDKDLLIYAYNGTLFGQYNTSSPVVPVPSGDFQIILKPHDTNLLEDPAGWLQDSAFPYVQTNFIPLIAFALVAGILIGRR